ncbi:hypothetical protein ACH5RR_017138 [Cinchona calisaya]|uniref:KIB1-4 beta-propeller domain-containing protein n=1 Tax=Cinchona calisaya TaxID=153742 RepID=A0ABD2ZXZ3_9GENT
METEEDWEWLPDLLLNSIIEKLMLPGDYVRFGAVCKHWRNVAVAHKYRVGPMLMTPTKNSRRSLYDVIRGNKIISGTKLLPMPLIKRRCCGSSYGWLAFAMDNLVIRLFNPFLGKQIDLPRLLNHLEDGCDPQYYVRKVVLSADPFKNPDDFEAVAIYGCEQKLAFIRIGQKNWTSLPVSVIIKSKFFACDVIFYDGFMYAVNRENEFERGRIIKVDTEVGSLEIVAGWNWKAENKFDGEKLVQNRAYLVESPRGDLLVINRIMSYPSKENCTIGRTSKFKLHKIVRGKESWSMLVEVEQVSELGDDALFLGDNQSVSILASEFMPGYQPNSIYFTDDFFYPHEPRDMGIFNLKDQSFKRRYKLNPLHKASPPPIWITPPTPHHQ